MLSFLSRDKDCSSFFLLQQRNQIVSRAKVAKKSHPSPTHLVGNLEALVASGQFQQFFNITLGFQQCQRSTSRLTFF